MLPRPLFLLKYRYLPAASKEGKSKAVEKLSFSPYPSLGYFLSLFRSLARSFVSRLWLRKKVVFSISKQARAVFVFRQQILGEREQRITRSTPEERKQKNPKSCLSVCSFVKKQNFAVVSYSGMNLIRKKSSGSAKNQLRTETSATKEEEKERRRSFETTTTKEEGLEN